MFFISSLTNINVYKYLWQVLAEDNQALQNADAISTVGDDAMGVPPVSATETVVTSPDTPQFSDQVKQFV